MARIFHRSGNICFQTTGSPEKFQTRKVNVFHSCRLKLSRRRIANLSCFSLCADIHPQTTNQERTGNETVILLLAIRLKIYWRSAIFWRGESFGLRYFPVSSRNCNKHVFEARTVKEHCCIFTNRYGSAVKRQRSDARYATNLFCWPNSQYPPWYSPHRSCRTTLGNRFHGVEFQWSHVMRP